MARLKEAGLQAKNPDQSTSMFRGFYETLHACEWKGFSREDARIIFEEALKEVYDPHRESD